MYPPSAMECSGLAVILTALLALGLADEVHFGGFIGCRFSRFVCQIDEECVDDNLFGSCQKVDSPRDLYHYHLNRGSLYLLEEEITRLISKGYTWNSLYTQCVVGNILLAVRLEVIPDRSWCDHGGAPPARYQEALSDDSKMILSDYFTDYYNNDQPALMSSSSLSPGGGSDGMDDVVDDDDVVRDRDVIDVEPYELPEKKDEFVTIHKYFADKRAKDARLRQREEAEEREREREREEEEDEEEEKAREEEERFTSRGRFPIAEDYPSDFYPFLAADADDAEADEDGGLMAEDRGLDENLSSLVDELRPKDLLLLRAYLQDMDRVAASDEDQEEDGGVGGGDVLDEPLPPPPREVSAETTDGVSDDGDSDVGYVWQDRELTEGGGMPFEPADGDISESERFSESPFSQGDEEIPEDNPPMTLTPPDAKLLGDLIEDKVDVKSLSDEEIRRLLAHVDNMLNNLEEMQPDKAQEAASNILEDANGDVGVSDTGTEEEKRAKGQGPIGMDTPEVTQALPDPHDTSFDQGVVRPHTQPPKLAVLNTLQGYMHVSPAIKDEQEGEEFLEEVESILQLPRGSLAVDSVKDGDVIFDVSEEVGVDAEMVSKQALEAADRIQNRTRLTLEDAGVGDDTDKLSVTSESTSRRNGPKYFVLTFVLCGSIAGIVLAVIALYVVKRHSRSRDKLKALAAAADGQEPSKDYQDLCRQRMQSKSSEKPEAPQTGVARVSSVASESAVRSPSSRSSTSSWSEEPVASNMDISTGHIVLSYMEDHLKNKDRLDEEWEALCAYEAEPSTTTVGSESSNMRKNRYSDVLPYDHSRVILSSTPNVSGSDYINANTITDHDPRNPAYIATQGPLPHTVADFWQMVWEQGSVVIVSLTKLTENGVAMCHRYWPEEGSDLYHIYEVHLVSEHIWCDDYLVRSFYLKNLQTNETRTVTQFHFLTWPDLGIPGSAKALLEFRSDGVGRTGAYCLIDMVLNRMSKGAKEIDIAATLEHIRDQRGNMVKTKEQFEFVLASVAEEVHAILKALPQ